LRRSHQSKGLRELADLVFTVKRRAVFLVLCGLLACPGTAQSTTYTVQAADIWDTGYDNVATPRQSTIARFLFTTDAGSVTITGTTNLYDRYPQYAQLGVTINGVQQSTLNFSANGSQGFAVTLGSAGTTRTVEVIAGVQSNPEGPGAGTVIGSFIDSITYPAANSLGVLPPTTGERLLIYGDSITEGANATTPVYQGYPALLRTTYGLRVALESWGYRALNDDGATSAERMAFVAQLAGYSPTIIVFAIGTNDYGLSRWSATSFGAAYGATLDAIHASMQSVTVVCITPIVRSDESANSHGSTLGDYRAQIETACEDRSSYTVLIDGTAILTTADLDDGVHPTTAGQAKYAAHVAPILSSLPGLTAVAGELSVAARNLMLDSPFPNPMAGGTTFRFAARAAEGAELALYDARGRLVEQLARVRGDGVVHTMEWSAGEVANGMYFAVLRGGAERVTQKLIISR
jgi:lysophospholipase L1-like esterase